MRNLVTAQNRPSREKVVVQKRPLRDSWTGAYRNKVAVGEPKILPICMPTRIAFDLIEIEAAPESQKGTPISLSHLPTQVWLVAPPRHLGHGVTAGKRPDFLFFCSTLSRFELRNGVISLILMVFD